MLLGIAIVAADVNALRHHAMVHGGSLNGLLISPWFEMPLGLLAIYFGWLLLRGHAVSK